MVDGYQLLIDDFDKRLADLGITPGEARLDHVAYKCCSEQDYQEKKLEVLKEMGLVYEGNVRGCDLGIFKFTIPVNYKNHTLVGLEFLKPKEGEICGSFWEHVEYVVSDSLQVFVDKHPNVKWDVGAIDKEIFSKIAIRFEGGLSAKFHVKNVLEEVTKF